MPLDDIPEVPPYPIKHSIVLHPFLEVFRSHDYDHDTHDEVENFGTNFISDTEPQPLSHAVDLFLMQDAHRSAFLECRPIPARHEVTLSSFADVSRPIPDMDAGSQVMSIPIGRQEPAAHMSTSGTTSDTQGLDHGDSAGFEGTAPMHTSSSAGRGPENYFQQTLFTRRNPGSAFQTHSHPATERRKGMRKLRKMIARGAFHNAAERYNPPKCHPGTRKTVLKKIMDWVQGLEDSERGCFFMWLYGPAGAGKSAIAQTIAELCHELKLLAASFFFSWTTADRSDHSRLIATLSYQLCLSIPEIRTYVEEVVERDPDIFSLSLDNQLRTLILNPLLHFRDNLSRYHGRIHPMLIILDGLDECASANRVQADVLQVLAERLPIPMFFLVTSRPKPDIRDFFTAEPMASITTSLALDNSYQPDADVKPFFQEEFGVGKQKRGRPPRYAAPDADVKPSLKAKFDASKRDHPLKRESPESWPSSARIDYQPGADAEASLKAGFDAIKRDHPLRHELPESWPSTVHIDNLIRDSSAAGRFTYPSIVMKYVESPHHRPTDRLEIILGIMDRRENTQLATLDALYTHIFSLVEDVNTVLEVFSVLLLVKRTVPKIPALMEDLLGLRRGDLNIVLIDLHSVLDIPAQPDGGEIRVLHSSLGDFLLDRTRSGNYHINQGHAHANLTQRFMKCISQKVTGNDDTSVLGGLSSAIFTMHCSQSHPTEELLDALWTWDVSAFWTLYFSETWKQTFVDVPVYVNGAPQLLDFLAWLRNTGSSKEGQDLYSHYISTWDGYMRHSLTQLSPGRLESQYIVFFILNEIRNNYPEHHVFGADHGSFSKISFTLKLHTGHLGYHSLLAEFFGDPSRSGPFYLDGDKYADFAMTFTYYILSPRADWRNWKYDLSYLSMILSKASFSEELATFLDSMLVRGVRARDPTLAQSAVRIAKAYRSNTS